jgi:hypothetical protein
MILYILNVRDWLLRELFIKQHFEKGKNGVTKGCDDKDYRENKKTQIGVLVFESSSLLSLFCDSTDYNETLNAHII